MVADHKKELVKEHYETGSIDKKRMRSKDAVQPQCPTCSAKQGAEMINIQSNKRNFMDLIKEQKLICDRYGAPFSASPFYLKVGVSMNLRDGIYPVNGIRHPIQGDTTGWYIWAGDYSSASDFFKPLHVEHLEEWCPYVLKYLGLSPGWRFQIAPDYEDVWEDVSLTDIE
ncbi:MAG: immunity protein Imm33 domain-containing protein [Mucilaginibacter sp.]